MVIDHRHAVGNSDLYGGHSRSRCDGTDCDEPHFFLERESPERVYERGLLSWVPTAPAPVHELPRGTLDIYPTLLVALRSLPEECWMSTQRSPVCVKVEG